LLAFSLSGDGEALLALEDFDDDEEGSSSGGGGGGTAWPPSRLDLRNASLGRGSLELHATTLAGRDAPRSASTAARIARLARARDGGGGGGGRALLGEDERHARRRSAFVHFGVDATTLHDARPSGAAGAEREAAADAGALSVARLLGATAAPFDFICWNFPLADLPDDEGRAAPAASAPTSLGFESGGTQRRLLLRTFRSLAVVQQRQRQQQQRRSAASRPPAAACRFVLTLQGDQFSRWRVGRIARRALWRLVAWGAFDARTFGRYAPTAGDETDTPFRPERPMAYIFEFAG